MRMFDLAAPPKPLPTPGWNAVLTDSQHLAISICLSVTLIALLLALGWFTLNIRNIATPYRRAYNAGVLVLTVASLSYALLIFKFTDGYNLIPLPGPDLWAPNQSSLFQLPLRYIDWAITVPLLIVELIGVSRLNGPRGYRLRSVGMLAGFAMIFAGWVGAQVIDNGYNVGARLTWGLISTFFFLIVYGIVIYVLWRAVPETASGSSRLFRSATILLMVTWFIYPVVYGVQGLASGGEVVLFGQVAYCIADVVSKVGFGALVLTVALRRSRHLATADSGSGRDGGAGAA